MQVDGEPAPAVTWSRAVAHAALPQCAKFENRRNESTFEMVQPKCKDSGIYTITAVNSEGVDSVNVQVNLLFIFIFFDLTVLKF